MVSYFNDNSHAQSIYNGLIAYYPFNGNVNDESGNGNSGTVYGATLASDRFGNTNSAYYFNGTSDYIEVPHSESLNFQNELTLAVWVKSDEPINPETYVIAKGDEVPFSLRVKTGFYDFVIGNNRLSSIVSPTSTTPREDVWHFIVGTYDGTIAKIYIDGILEDSDLYSQNMLSNNNQMQFGHRPSSRNSSIVYYKGAIDDIRIYDRALSIEEILELYNEGESGLVAYYPFFGNANDESGNGNNGTVYGATLTSDRFGNSNSAYDFDGDNDQIVTPISGIVTNSISLCAWYKVRTYTTGASIISSRSTDDGGYKYSGLDISNNPIGSSVLIFSKSYGSNVYTTDERFRNNEWHFAVGTYDGEMIRLYGDGQFLAETAATGVVDMSGNYIIGFDNNSAQNRFFDGIIDEVRIYDRALDELEILGLYHENGWDTNRQPIADAGYDQTVECTGAGGTSVTLNGIGSSDPDGDDLTYSWSWDGGSATGPDPIIVLESGMLSVYLIVNDGTINSEPDTVNITVEDTTPPTLNIENEMITLWPPNHKYEEIKVTDFNVSVKDKCDEDISVNDVIITAVSSDEVETTNGNGDGNTNVDIVIVNCNKINLMRERDGNGNGRVYTISLSVSDALGNIGREVCYVTVPHSKKETAMDDGAKYSIDGCGIDLPLPKFSGNVTANEVVAPNEYRLSQNYPNPFNPTTKIKYSVPPVGTSFMKFVSLKVYDILGNKVATLVNEEKPVGTYEVEFNGSGLSSGVYFYQVKAEDFIETKKMLLMK